MGIAFGSNNKANEDEREKLIRDIVKDIESRLYNAGIPNVSAIMSHVGQAFKSFSMVEIRELTDLLYSAHGSEDGSLFRIPSEYRDGVEGVVRATLRHVGLW